MVYTSTQITSASVPDAYPTSRGVPGLHRPLPTSQAPFMGPQKAPFLSTTTPHSIIPSPPQSHFGPRGIASSEAFSSDVDLPSWTALSTDATTDEEDALLSDSRATTPEPADQVSTKETSLYQLHHEHGVSTTIQDLPRPLTSRGAGVHTSTKRGPTHILEGATSSRRPPAKKARRMKASVSASTDHGARAGPHPLSATAKLSHSTASSRASHRDQTAANRVPDPDISQLNALSRAAGPSWSRSGAPATFAGAPMRPQRRTRAPPPITEDSDMTEWNRVDDLLETHVAPSSVLPAYAQSLSLREGGAQRKVHVSLQLDEFRQRSKGKQREQPPRTAACWSNVGEFKERLDRMFGTGDITRGMGRAPKNAKKHTGTSAIDPGVPGSTDRDDLRSDAEGTTGMDGEESDSTVRLTRRGRLEKAGPRRVEPHV